MKQANLESAKFYKYGSNQEWTDRGVISSRFKFRLNNSTQYINRGTKFTKWMKEDYARILYYNKRLLLSVRSSFETVAENNKCIENLFYEYLFKQKKTRRNACLLPDKKLKAMLLKYRGCSGRAKGYRETCLMKISKSYQCVEDG